MSTSDPTPPADSAPHHDSKLSATLNLLFKIAIGAIVALLAFKYLGNERSSDALHHPGVGEKLGEVSLQPLTGDPPSLDSKHLAGRVVLMNFWGPWCGYCKQELPHLVELNQRLASQPDFLLVSVSSSGGRDDSLDPIRRDTEKYLDRARLPLPTYGDRDAVTRDMLHQLCQLKNFFYPFTVAIDRAGVIRGVWAGYSPGSELEMERLLRELLGPAQVADR